MDIDEETSTGSEEGWLPEPPEELTRAWLRRAGEGVGRVVYASDHWVVKRERSPTEVVAIIVLWHGLRKLKRVLPHGWVDWLMRGPSREIRFLRVLVQGIMLVVPKSIWFTTHIRKVWRMHTSRDVRGSRLAELYLNGTGLTPLTVQFPPTSVRLAGWPGRLTVSSATERVESTLYERLSTLARSGRFDEIEIWLMRYLELRQSGWARGLFSVDAHLKNFGICGDRVVLLDTGGLTNRWSHIMEHLSSTQGMEEPHRRLGLSEILRGRPDVASRFDTAWKEIVSPEGIRERWPSD